MAHLEAQHGMLWQYNRQMYFATKYSTEYLRRRVADNDALQTKNNLLPNFWRSTAQQYNSRKQFPNPRFSDELTNYFNKKMKSIYDQYPFVLPVSDQMTASAQSSLSMSTQVLKNDCGKILRTIHKTIPLKRISHGSLGMSDAPNCKRANPA